MSGLHQVGGDIDGFVQLGSELLFFVFLFRTGIFPIEPVGFFLHLLFVLILLPALLLVQGDFHLILVFA